MQQISQNYLPVQQYAVQQQMQQGQVPMVTQMQTPAPKSPEYNAIKIDIVKPEVNAAPDPIYSMPYAPIYSYPPAQAEPQIPAAESIALQQPVEPESVLKN